VLTRLLGRIAAGHFSTRDFTLDRLRAALRSYIVHFPVYRTYISGLSLSERDRAIIAHTVAGVRTEWHGGDAVVLDFLKDVLTLDIVRTRSGYSGARVRRFATKVQQLTGPVTAKALEDTAFYRFHRLLALNEVGGEPSLGALAIDTFHGRMQARAREAPAAMSATATHDTKRGEDARTRILAIAELADEWAPAVGRWNGMNAPLHAGRAPTVAHEYMLYQALIGAWPLAGVDADFVARMQAYVVKASREGKQETSWLNPNQDYEDSFAGFVAAVLGSAGFVEDFDAFARRTALVGALTSLSQLVLKATLPGVPDFYQGTESWDLSLVDPDNRRAVDFSARAASLAANAAPDWSRLVDGWPGGDIKLAMTAKLLDLRGHEANVFARGRYVPLATQGRDADHVIAFARADGRRAVVVAVGRHFAALSDGGRRLPRGADWDANIRFDGFRLLQDIFTGVTPPADGRAATLFAAVPVAVLRAAWTR
jgi:(1->4)-alpha-D-glucan 1-alpha-D-glucosylmutase